MRHKTLYEKYKYNIDHCVNSINNTIFKPLNINPIGFDLRIEYSKKFNAYFISLIHYITSKDRDLLGDMNHYGELDDELDSLIDQADFEFIPHKNYKLYIDAPIINGYVYPDGKIYSNNTPGIPSIQFYHGQIPAELVDRVDSYVD